jgi:hypothetical protein
LFSLGMHIWSWIWTRPGKCEGEGRMGGREEAKAGGEFVRMKNGLTRKEMSVGVLGKKGATGEGTRDASGQATQGEAVHILKTCRPLMPLPTARLPCKPDKAGILIGSASEEREAGWSAFGQAMKRHQTPKDARQSHSRERQSARCDRHVWGSLSPRMYTPFSYPLGIDSAMPNWSKGVAKRSPSVSGPSPVASARRHFSGNPRQLSTRTRRPTWPSQRRSDRRRESPLGSVSQPTRTSEDDKAASMANLGVTDATPPRPKALRHPLGSSRGRFRFPPTCQSSRQLGLLMASPASAASRDLAKTWSSSRSLCHSKRKRCRSATRCLLSGKLFHTPLLWLRAPISRPSQAPVPFSSPAILSRAALLRQARHSPASTFVSCLSITFVASQYT